MNSNRAFSLVEVLTTVLILAIGIIGLAATFQASLGRTYAAQNNIQAAIIADSVLTELSNTKPANWDAGVLEGNFHYTFEGDRVDKDHEDAFFSVEVTSLDQNAYKKVTIGVTWRGWTKDISTGLSAEDANYAYVVNADVTTPYDTPN